MSDACPASGCAFEAPALRSYGARVVSNERIHPDHFVLRFSPPGPPDNVPDPRPGQFYMIGVGASFEPLLKRPFCHLGAEDCDISVLYRVRGKGTALLSRVRSGERLEIVGPLGTPWPEPGPQEGALLVAGGVGIASLYPLLSALGGRARIVYGARTARDMLLIDGVRGLAGLTLEATEDGSMGHCGTAMDVLAGLEMRPGEPLYACGPRGLLRAVQGFARERGLGRAYLSLEEYMACGIGACMGCAVETTNGYVRVCREGPVFPALEVVI